MTESDTPETDAAQEECGKLLSMAAMYGYMSEAARELERRLAQAQARVAELERWHNRAKPLLAQFALGYDTFNEPDTCLNWAQVEELVKETRAFLTEALKSRP